MIEGGHVHMVAKSVSSEVHDHEQQGQHDENDHEHHDPPWNADVQSAIRRQTGGATGLC
jgi:hypothetical protein